jgi:hypothetical protein
MLLSPSGQKLGASRERGGSPGPRGKNLYITNIPVYYHCVLARQRLCMVVGTPRDPLRKVLIMPGSSWQQPL